MRRTALTTLAAVAGLSAIAAAVAIAAPVASKAPTITGKPDFAQKLTCNKGTWSADVVSFSYAWAISGGSTFASGQMLKVPASAIGFNLVCIVTATDAQGNATPASSSQVLIGQGIATVRITKAVATHGVVTISGFVGPRAALKKGPSGSATVVLDRELTSKSDVQQISNGPKIVKAKNGAFTISGHDVKGTHTYIINFDPSIGSGYAPARVTRTVTVR